MSTYKRNTVESPIVDALDNLSTKDTAGGHKMISPYSSNTLLISQRGQLPYKGQKCCPKCPLFGDSTVHHNAHTYIHTCTHVHAHAHMHTHTRVVGSSNVWWGENCAICYTPTASHYDFYQ